MKNGVSSESYFEKSGGVPLAIITIASIWVSNNQIEQTMIGCACSMQWVVGLQKVLVWKKKKIIAHLLWSAFSSEGLFII